LKIPHRVIVENSGYELSESYVRARLLKTWKKSCKDCKLILSYLSLPILPEDLKEKPWELIIPSQLPRGTFSVRLEVKGQERRPEIYWVNGKLEVHRKVPVATRA